MFLTPNYTSNNRQYLAI